jgi:large subunit ribosomal protein L24
MKKLRKGDEVVVIAGRDKGRRGAILKLLEGERVVVENVNMAKKHQKPNPQKNIQSAIIEKEMPLHISNVALWNPATKKADRVGIRTLADHRRVRFFKSNKEVVDV